MYCHNITLIIKVQINILNIEYVITNSYAGVGNRRRSPTMQNKARAQLVYKYTYRLGRYNL